MSIKVAVDAFCVVFMVSEHQSLLFCYVKKTTPKPTVSKASFKWCVQCCYFGQ